MRRATAELATLDARMLADIGLAPSDVVHARRAVWPLDFCGR